MTASLTPILLDSTMAVLAIVLAFLFWRKGTKQFKLHFVVMSLLVCGLAVSYMFELFSSDLDMKLLWNNVEYVSIVGIPWLYFLIVVKYAGREDMLTRRNILMVSIVPIFTLAMVWTNGLHHLFYESVSLSTDANQTYSSVKGPAYMLHLVYSIGLVVMAIGVVFAAFIRSPRFQRTQIGLVLLSGIIPTAFIASYSFGFPFPVSLVDGMIIAFILSSVFLYLGVFRFGLFSATPLVLHSIADIMQDGAIMLNQADQITYLNPMAIRISQRGNTHPLGRPIGEVFPSIHAAIGQENEGSRTIEMIGPGGDPLRIEVHIYTIGAAPTQLGRLLILRDISSLRRSEEALVASNAKLSVMCGVTRHDILNRTNVIRGYGQLLADNKNAPRSEEYLQKMLDSTAAIEHIINFTKEYERVGVESPEWQNVAKKYQKAKVLCAEQRVEYIVDAASIEIYADPMLERLFYILLDNSYNHGLKVTRISLTARPVGEECLIVYEDNGVGVSPENKKLIFRKGFGKDSGLGLYLGTQILAITGIGIRENGVPSHGARFEIEVPKGMWRYVKN
jgi:signal transduction histidine kinase